MNKLEQSIKNSKLIHFCYKLLDFFEKGKSLPSRIYAPYNEVILLLTYLTVSFDLKFSFVQILTAIITVVLAFILFGMFVVKFGLQHLDSHTRALHDPVQKKLLEAAEIIIKENNRKVFK